MRDAHDVIWRLVEDVYGKGKVELIDELAHEDYFEVPMPEGFAPDREGLKSFVQALHAALSDVEAQVERVLVDDGQVAWRWRMTGRHTGEFMGIPASGNPIETTGNDVAVLRDGKLEKRWCEQDQLSLMVQIGAIDLATSPA